VARAEVASLRRLDADDRWVDTQQIEIVGRSLLTAMLVADDIEVATPLRDRGVDLFAYLDTGFVKAVPLQLKSYSGHGFSVNRKYEKFDTMRIVHLWHVHEPSKAQAFCLTNSESFELAQQFGWTATASWRKGRYSVTKPGPKVVAALQPFLVRPGEWPSRLFGDAPNT
jgi:hypothetical protein